MPSMLWMLWMAKWISSALRNREGFRTSSRTRRVLFPGAPHSAPKHSFPAQSTPPPDTHSSRHSPPPCLIPGPCPRFTATWGQSREGAQQPYRTEVGMPVVNAPPSECFSSVFMRFRSYETDGKWPSREQPVEDTLRWIDYEPQVPRLTAILRYSAANGLYQQTTESFWSRLMAVNEPSASQLVAVMEPTPVSSRKRRLDADEEQAAGAQHKNSRSVPGSQRS
ncbi:hypothetical protein Vafri_13203 [Volvox africanus]|uniref:Uncharacterized protein n=1 Tax=Volvox africanus TaxID=51714 RepID=A0A8J4F569_9CHLO|nr:hypothetical protein Vafri_13203 [Volvox africanus]